MKAKCKTAHCFNEGCCRDGMCADHTAAQRQKRNHAASIPPRSRDPHIGVEIECIARNSKAHKAMLAQRSLPCSDGSLGDYGCEYKVCAPADKVVRKASLLVDHVRRAGAFVNSSCGLHVHLDARYVGQPRVLEICQWLKTQQEWLFCLMPKSRRSNSFCERTINNGHYSWCNYTGRRTIEIRLHGGTLNPHKICGWLSAMRCILEKMNKPTMELPPFVGTTSNPFTEVEPARTACPPVDPRTGNRDRAAVDAWRISENAWGEWVHRKERATRDGLIKCNDEWLKKAYPCPIAQEYLLARQSANGHLDRMEELTGETRASEASSLETA